MSYFKPVVAKPHFAPYDICRVVGTHHIVIITEVSLNLSQSKDEHQWSYSVALTDKNSNIKSSWYESQELELLNNVFEIIAKQSVHPFGSKNYKFTVSEIRR